MSENEEIGLNSAREGIESVEPKVRERLARARQLSEVMERKRDEENHDAFRNRARGVSRVLGEAERMLDEHDRHRDHLHEHVKTHPQIEGGVYHGRVQTYDDLAQTVTERRQWIDMELAIARCRQDVATERRAQSSDWEEQYDAVRETVTLLTHVRMHDVPALVQAYEHRDHDDRFQYPTDGITGRLDFIRERASHVETIDHDAVVRDAATVNGELASDYRDMVARFREKYAALERELAAIGALLAGTTDDRPSS